MRNERPSATTCAGCAVSSLRSVSGSSWHSSPEESLFGNNAARLTKHAEPKPRLELLLELTIPAGKSEWSFEYAIES